MSSSAPTPSGQADRPQNSALRLFGSLALRLPAILAGLGGRLWPSLTTLLASLQKNDLLGPAQFAGLQNHAPVLGDRLFAQALNYTLPLAAVRLVTVAIGLPLLAFIIPRSGRGVRLTTRLLFTLPLAMYAPAAIAVNWPLPFRSTRG